MNVRSLFSSETSSDEVANPGKVEEHQFGNELCPLGDIEIMKKLFFPMNLYEEG